MSDDLTLVVPPKAHNQHPNYVDLPTYQSYHAESTADVSKYWDGIARTALNWFAPYTSTITGSFTDGNFAFFTNGKLNMCYNCLDRWVESGKGNDIAVRVEQDEPGIELTFTFQQVLNQVCQVANMMKTQGVRKGDAVTIYMPMKIDVVVAMLACARIGAVHSVIFAGFSSGMSFSFSNELVNY